MRRSRPPLIQLPSSPPHEADWIEAASLMRAGCVSVARHPSMREVVAIRFGVLGPLRTDRAINASMLRRLLAALLCRAGAPVPIEDLLKALWGETAPPTSRKTLQVYIRRLRSLLADEQRIVHEPAGYQLNLAPGELDAVEFERLVAAARTEPPERSAPLFIEALGLWRGPAYEDVREFAPMADEAHRLDEERLRAEADLASAQLALGRHDEMIPRLRNLTHAHPFRENLRGHLMVALYRAGRQEEALTTFRGTRKLLAEELGVEPGPALQRLHEAILRASPELDLPSTRPSSVPRELPAGIGGFVGRAEQISTLDSMLSGSASPVVISAIAGTAGVGKTALAVHWSHRVADRFRDGQLYLNLNGFSSSAPMQPIEALASMLRSIGVPAEKVPVEQAEAAAMFRSQMSGRQMLLLLDNARSADQIRPLLPGDPGTLVLITSRNSLSGLVAREGARRLNLDVLTPEEAHALLAEVLGIERVSAEPDATAALARVCAHLPLALRVAAANLNDRPHRTIASHVASLLAGNRLGSLSVDGDEQAAVKVAFDLSYLDMPPEIRRTFRLLGLIPGLDFTAPAVAALTGLSTEDTEAHLVKLANAHLIDQTAPDRYTFHDLLRLYAQESTTTHDSPEDRATATRHLFDWYVHCVDAAATLLYPSLIRLPSPTRNEIKFEEANDALAWLDAELPNLVAAIHRAGRDGPRNAAWLLTGYLRGYLARRKHVANWLSIAQVGLDAAVAGQDVRAQASAHLTLAHAYRTRNMYPQAGDHLRKAAARARETSWPALEATCLTNLGGVLYETATMNESAELTRRGLSRAREAGYEGGQAAALSNLGVVTAAAGRLPDAAELLQSGAAMHSQLGWSQSESEALADLAKVKWQLGHLNEARDGWMASLTIKRSIGDRLGQTFVLADMASICSDHGMPAVAERFAEHALELAREFGDQQVESAALSAFGRIHLNAGRLEAAYDTYKLAAEVARPAGLRYVDTVAMLGLAATWHRLGRVDDALEAVHHALKLAQGAGFGVRIGQALTLLAQIEMEQGNKAEALLTAHAALENHRSTGHRMGEADTLLVLADVEMDAVTAAEYRDKAEEIYAAIRDCDLTPLANMSA